MDQEKNENTNIENENNQEENKNVENLDEILSKYKDTEEFKGFIANIVAENTKGLVQNRDELLKEVKELKTFRKQAQEDEVTKLMLEGTEEARKKAIELLTAEAVKPYQQLIEEKDAILKQKEEFENQVKVEKEQKLISDAYGKLTINSNIDDEAHKDILPVIYQNFKLNEKGELAYTGKEINKAGKPLSMEEFIVAYIENGRKYYLKDRTGSNALFKTTTEATDSFDPSKETYPQFEARMLAAKRKR